jgi:hypothetical protein
LVVLWWFIIPLGFRVVKWFHVVHGLARRLDGPHYATIEFITKCI